MYICDVQPDVRWPLQRSSVAPQSYFTNSFGKKNVYSLDHRMFQAVRSCDRAKNGIQLHLIIPPTGGNRRVGSTRDEGSAEQK